MTRCELIAKGYCVTSRRHKTISRIDSANWKYVLAKHHSPWDINGEGMEWVNNIGERNAEDYYRRCISKDSIVVSDINGIPNSSNTVTGYRDKTK